jgi:hypothetical protein
MENEILRAAAERVRLSLRPQTIAGQEALGRVFWQVLPAVRVQEGGPGNVQKRRDRCQAQIRLSGLEALCPRAC